MCRILCCALLFVAAWFFWPGAVPPALAGQPVILRLTPGATLHCHVLEAAGKPNTHATVQIARRFDAVTNQPQPAFFAPNGLKTDYKGDLEYRNLVPGGYVLMVGVYPALPYSRRVIVTAPETSVTLKPDPLPPGH